MDAILSYIWAYTNVRMFQILNFLFDGDATQLDLVALNIQRAREHGIPGYVAYRQVCGVNGGREVRSFGDLDSNISNEVSHTCRTRLCN